MLEQLADAVSQAVTDIDTGSRLAGDMLDALGEDLARERAAEGLWAEVKRLEAEKDQRL